ncbi:unnamed protein product [Thlaspi arvense]|uniref:Uncharacterized protein n=1 Tax=Thlaspi arvense TaxID=13288 RepID=A0AAU9RK02_THLAR|nr:unnamed protein product [Thlaspi arvense]
MESASSVSLLHGGDAASYYCLPNRLINAKQVRVSTRFWDHTRVLHLGSRLRKNVAQSATPPLNAGFTGSFYCHSHPIVGYGRRFKPIPFGFRSHCHGNDSLAGVDPNPGFSESNDESEAATSREEKDEAASLEELRVLLHKATRELEVARLNSTMFEEKAQRISETAIALKDQAASVWDEVNKTLDVMRDTVDEESVAKEAVQKATMALSLAEARLQVVVESLDVGGGNGISEASEKIDDVDDKEEAILAAKDDIKECQVNLANCEAQLSGLLSKKDELQKEVDKLNELAETIQISALKAEEDVANIMKLAEQAVAFELEATQRVNDAEIALQKAEKSLFISQAPEETPLQDEVVLSSNIEDVSHQVERESPVDEDLSAVQNIADLVPDKVGHTAHKLAQPHDSSDHENGKPSVEPSKVVEADSEKPKIVVPTKKQETQKDLPKEGSSPNTPKASFNKSSRFFSASFFSSNPDGNTTVFASLVASVKQQWPKLVLGVALLGAGSVSKSTLRFIII